MQIDVVSTRYRFSCVMLKMCKVNRINDGLIPQLQKKYKLDVYYGSTESLIVDISIGQDDDLLRDAIIGHISLFAENQDNW